MWYIPCLASYTNYICNNEVKPQTSIIFLFCIIKYKSIQLNLPTWRSIFYKEIVKWTLSYEETLN